MLKNRIRQEHVDEAKRDESAEELENMLMEDQSKLDCEEYNLKSKSGQSHLLAAYANEEVSDIFDFNDKE